MATTMKAFAAYKYGPPSSLQLVDLPVPEPRKNEILIRVKATTINDWDWGIVRGKPRIYRLLFGLGKPKSPVPGMELSGIVEKVGSDVNGFQPGDEVYGDISDHGWGTWAEYICVPESCVVKKPAEMSFEEAAAIPHAAMLAYQGLIDEGEIEDGQQVLINGAGGGMGSYGIQLARLYDVEVTGVDSAGKLETMKSIGFDAVFDYREVDFTASGIRYDLILDAKTTRSPFRYLKALKPGGKYVTVGGHVGRLMQLALLKGMIKLFTGKRLAIVALKPNKDLFRIHELHEEGKIKAVIDGPHAFKEIPRLLQFFGDGKHKGKIVISLD